MKWIDYTSVGAANENGLQWNLIKRACNRAPLGSGGIMRHHTDLIYNRLTSIEILHRQQRTIATLNTTQHP